MHYQRFYKLNLWLERKLSFPGCTDKQLQGNITVFENHLFFSLGTIPIFVIPLLIFAPQLTIYISYMIAFSILYTLSLLLQLIFPARYLVIHVCTSSTMHLMTFYTILQLGGIPTSGGLIFAGISNVLATIPRQRSWFPVSMFILFCILTVLLVVLKPWFHVPDQMTPELNSFLFMAVATILTGGALGFVMQFIKQQRKIEEMETKQLKEMNEFRDRFFTNVTHEFRTPLTIINGMADLIRDHPEKWMVAGLNKIKTNSGILLRLVNQMLNLAKTESGAVPVKFLRRDVNRYLAYLVEQFSSEAHKKRIDLRFITMQDSFEMDFDPEKLLHITTNLVSNALKFTPGGGRVEVITSAVENGRKFSIRIKDTGIGIEKEHIEHLFDRFYRVDRQLSSGGTGIGLALTKEMVLLLNGTVSVESTAGEGSEFTVILPVTRSAPECEIPAPSELITLTDDIYAGTGSFNLPAFPVQKNPEFPAGAPNPSDLPLLLIIEDSSDVLMYLHALLSSRYRIETAGNGKTGLATALEIIPDIILSDIMMPVMDGIEMLQKVKNDVRTSHIPVVLLTARADIESRLAGLERGADAYLAKPVDERELDIQLKNLIELRRRLYERYRSLEVFPETTDTDIKKEDEFMLKVRQILEKNLEDEEFGISNLCKELAVSRAQLYRKVKSLSNISISDYFKSLRLFKARELLSTTSLNITGVAFATGFKSLSYFSREFAREFGKSPSEFRK